MEWADRVRSLLCDGETVEERFDLEGGTLVVTSHRVLAFVPNGDGANYHRVDRPNVAGVRIAAGGDWTPLRRAATFGLAGGVLLVVAATVSFESFLSIVGPVETGGGGAAGTGGVDAAVGAIDSVRRFLAMLDALVLVVGLLLTAAAVGFAGLYLRSRRRVLRIAIAGREDLDIRVADPESNLVDRLEAAIRPGSCRSEEGSSRWDGGRSDDSEDGTAETEK